MAKGSHTTTFPANNPAQWPLHRMSRHNPVEQSLINQLTPLADYSNERPLPVAQSVWSQAVSLVWSLCGYSSIRINASGIGSMQLILWVAACYSMLWDCISVIWLLLVLCTESDSMACLLMIGYPGELAPVKGAHNKAQIPLTHYDSLSVATDCNR